MSVGLDIGSRTIKIVELEKRSNGFGLIASGIVGHQGNLTNLLKDEKECLVIAEAVKKLHKEARVGSREINFALPETLVFTRTIRFPSLTDQEIASAVKWEAEQYIPIPANEAIIQYQIIEKDEKSGSNEVLILLIASPRNLVERYVKIVQMAGLTAVAVETELLALTRALAPEGKVAMILDFGATSTDIAIVKNNTLRFSRSIPTAGEAFTRALSQGLSMEYQQAEEYKKTYGLSENLEGKVKRTLDPVLGLVADEIKKAIHFYQTEEKGEAPASIVVSGGTAAMPEVISSFSSLLGLEIVIGNPFAKVIVDPATLKNLGNYGPLYSIAVGLALRND